MLSLVRRLAQSLQGWPGVFLGAFISGCFIWVGLTPFRWSPPFAQTNGAVRTPAGTIALPLPGAAFTPGPPDWLGEAIRTSACELSLRVRSLERDQTGPARILTISPSILLRNVTIGQQADDLVVRLRTPVSSENGMPQHVVQDVFQDSEWRDIRVSIGPGRLRVQVDGDTRLDEPVPERPLANWDDSYALLLGNEHTLDRPWIGEIAAATVTVGERQWNLLDAAAVLVPPSLWYAVRFQLLTPPEEMWIDLSSNYLCFVPLGFALACGWRRPLWAALFAVMLSLFVEAAQVGFATRMSSLSDWLSNSLGGITGAWIAGLALAAARTGQPSGAAQVSSLEGVAGE